MRAVASRLMTVAAACAMAVGSGLCPAADHDAETIDRLVSDLNDGSRSVREAADRTLREAGPQALPAIVAARERARGEAAFRLRSIQHTLEEAATLEAVDDGLATLAMSVARVEPVGSPPRAARIVLRATWKTPLDPLVIRLPLTSIVAEGPAGESMSVAQRLAVVEPSLVPGATAADLPLVLVQPEHALESLGLLRGTLRLWLAGRQHDFTIPLDAGQPRAVTVAGTTVGIDDLAIREGRLLVTARVAYDAPSEALASHRTWITQCPLEVIGDDDHALVRTDQTIVARSEQGLTARAIFTLPDTSRDRLPAGLRLRWRLPMALHEAPFDFAIRAVALPAALRSPPP